MENANIIRVKKDARYFAASNVPFNDVRLSWEARGVMGYLLSKPDNWNVSMVDLVRQSPAGMKVIRRILAELRQAGYMSRRRISLGDGKYSWITTLYETPELNTTIYPSSIDGSSIDGSSIDGSRIDAKRLNVLSTDVLISTELNNTELKTAKTKKSKPDIVDAIIENERKVINKSWSLLPEPYHKYAQAFTDATTLQYSKKFANDWMATFSDWQQAQYTPAMITEAVLAICDDGSTAITRPGSIDWKLRDMQVKRANRKPEPTPIMPEPELTGPVITAADFKSRKAAK